MDTKESRLSDGRSPDEPDWGEEPRAVWDAIVTAEIIEAATLSSRTGIIAPLAT
jgi:hypothetical protein